MQNCKSKQRNMPQIKFYFWLSHSLVHSLSLSLIRRTVAHIACALNVEQNNFRFRNDIASLAACVALPLYWIYSIIFILLLVLLLVLFCGGSRATNREYAVDYRSTILPICIQTVRKSNLTFSQLQIKIVPMPPLPPPLPPPRQT